MRRYFVRSHYRRRPGDRQLLIGVVLVLLLIVALSNRRGCSTVQAKPMGCDHPTAPLKP